MALMRSISYTNWHNSYLVEIALLLLVVHKRLLKLIGSFPGYLPERRILGSEFKVATMGIAFRFHLILVLAFCCLLFMQYRSGMTSYEQHLHQQANALQNSLNLLPTDMNGQQTYQALSGSFDFLFYQFIDPEDGRRNFTHGELNAGADPLLDTLFPDKNSAQVKRPGGDLQYVLNRPAVTSAIKTHFISWALVYLAIYLTLAMTFLFFLRSLKAKLGYAAQYIEELPRFQFSSVATSKLGPLLRPVTAALQSCRSELKQQIDAIAFENDQLQKVAYQDYLTGFGTTKKFSSLLDRLSQQSSPRLGVIVQVKGTELAFINKEKGHEAGDNYLLDISNAIKTLLREQADAESFRINATSFAVYLPDLSLPQAQELFEQLQTSFQDMQPKYLTDSIGYTAIVPCQTGTEPTAVLSLMDTAITIAMTQSANGVFVLESAPDDINAGDHQWQEVLSRIIDRKAIDFLHQPIQPCRHGVSCYTELLARFYNHAGNILPTQTVLAMASRYELSSELDKAIISCVLQMLEANTSLDDRIGININGSSVCDKDFLAWLKSILLQRKEIAARLVFEVSEVDMQSNLLAASRFVRLMHSLGAKVSVEQFGHGFTSFKFFREVSPDYIKLDASFTHHIDENANNRFYIKSLVDISRRVGVLVLVSAVERKEEKMELEKLLVDGLQGFYIARPDVLKKQKATG